VEVEVEVEVVVVVVGLSPPEPEPVPTGTVPVVDPLPELLPGSPDVAIGVVTGCAHGTPVGQGTGLGSTPTGGHDVAVVQPPVDVVVEV